MATVSVGKAGAINAGVLAAQILAVGDPAIARRLGTYKKRLEESVEQAADRLKSTSAVVNASSSGVTAK